MHFSQLAVQLYHQTSNWKHFKWHAHSTDMLKVIFHKLLLENHVLSYYIQMWSEWQQIHAYIYMIIYKILISATLIEDFSKIKSTSVLLQLYFCYPEQICVLEMGSSAGSSTCMLNISLHQVPQSCKWYITTEVKYCVVWEYFTKWKWLPICRDPSIQIIGQGQCRQAWWSQPTMPAQTTSACSLLTARQPLHLLPCHHMLHSVRGLIMGFCVAQKPQLHHCSHFFFFPSCFMPKDQCSIQTYCLITW